MKPLSYSQSLIHSVDDSAESVATPPDSDFEDKQLRKMLASPLYTEVSGKLDAESAQKREANAQRTQAYHSRRESLMLSSSRDLEVSGKPDAVFSCQSESSQNTFSKKYRSNEWENSSESGVHSVFRIADPANVGKSLLDGNKDPLLDQARSELMKQEHHVGSLHNCIDELQKQAYDQRLEFDDAAQHGYAESRREQVRLQEEFVIKEKALRDNQNRRMYEMGEMKRPQELRVEQFSVQKLRESHGTIQRLTSQMQDVIQGISRSGIKSQWEIVLGSQSTSNASKLSFYADPRQTPATWHMECVWTTGKRFW